nr:retrovirus-related Pol polyprotein from transposon TNT 1-94 [Tanacetum cinerariifolium]
MKEGNGPKWLFDIDSLTLSMNYVPVAEGTISNEYAVAEGTISNEYADASYFDSTSKDVKDGLHNEDDDKDKSEDNSSPKEVNAAGQHEYNVARTPQQNGVAERRNRTLTEAARIIVARTPQQNGVADRRNRTLIEPARTMLTDSKLPTTFWAEAVSTACYVQNRVLIVKPHNKTPYELFRGTISDESAGIQKDLNAGTSSGKEATRPDYIVMPVWKDASYFDTSSKDVKDGTHNEDDDKDKTEDDSSPKEINAVEQHIEPTRIAKALSNSSWMEAMHEELLQFKLQHAIGTKWVFRNKKDERGIVIRNKARLVSQGHRQEEGIDDNEYFALVARIEAIRLCLAYASYMGFLVNQMDVKSAFLYGTIKKEVYVTQPPRFKDPNHPDKVYKLVKALYGLHQTPRAWYDTLANYLLSNGFQRGKIDLTLFIKKQRGDILLVQIYVDDIIFGSTNKELCTAFEKLMKGKFQMMVELTFSLALQVTQKEDGIFISHDKYVHEILNKFNYSDVKSASTLVDLEKPLVKDGDANDVDDAFGNNQYKPKDIQELFCKLFNDMQNIHGELAEYINTPSWKCPAFYNNGEDDHKDYAIAITPDFLTTDSLIMGDKHLDTIPEKESDEFIKFSVDNLVLNPSEFEDECECDVPDCDDSQTTKFLTFSNSLFDDSTSSDDKSSYEE